MIVGVLGLVILSLAGASLFGSHGVRQLRALRQERQRQGERAIALLRENGAVREAIRKLREDEGFLETVARHDLGLVRPNETVYRFSRPERGRR